MRRSDLPARRAGAKVSDEFELLLVIGGGPAGLAAARGYRDAGGRGGVAIVSDEHRMPYRRPPLTKGLLRGEMSEDELGARAGALARAEPGGADLRAGRRAGPDRTRRSCSQVPERSPTAAACSPPGRSQGVCRSPGPTTRGCGSCERSTTYGSFCTTARKRRRGDRDRLRVHRLRDCLVAASPRNAGDARLRREGTQ